ncbi:FtsX-like permease family protein [Aneurinibacillus migulanus]|uniref:FtsX-like permease family protein n=1 Tax=Aneurinibacillus migulanus TaxID=47500 RepID=UPI002E1CD0EE|nr:FtsX-like permease family protein [Aneurinibacillus migulanus]MED4728262.1 FtsX-like permease family protein [Aneurinibacillus migulanus]
MTFRSLALSNIQGNWRSYSAFFMSSVFSVMIFYIYAAFLAHPDVMSGHIVAAEKVKKGMVFCEYVIVIFSFLFVLYSNSAFLKTRKQEFGLFSLFGMTRMQLRKLVIYENMAIAVLAIGVGIGLGILFSKLFFMALAVLLDINDPMVFAVPLGAVWLTAGSFLVLFAIISLWIALRMGRTEILDLLKASQQPKGQLVYSRWLVLLAVVCLGAAYSMALMLNEAYFDLLVLLILLTVIIGTYLLFTQLSIMLLKFIQKRVDIYYNRTNMIVFAQIGYKMKDNARMLFIVSILSAVILTATSAIYMLALAAQYQDIKTQYDNVKEVISLTMFIGMFISLLFFIASGSMIYFKLFTELQEDQAQFKALSRIGMTQGEIRRIVFTQVGIIFFVPCIVGIVHALVAMKALDNFLMLSSWLYSFSVIGIYVTMQTVYFLVACNSYMKSILRGAAS